MKTYKETLFSRLISSVGECRSQWPLGIQHIIESPNIVQLLRSWTAADSATKAEAERKVFEAFDEKIKMVLLPPALGAEEMEELVEIIAMWNSSHSIKCECLF